MLARCSLATFALVLGLTCPAVGQETGGKLQLPDNLFNGEGATSSGASSTTQSGVTGMEASPEYWENSGAPASYGAAGSSYSPSLGAHLRARYSTQSYGQPDGNLDLGTMFMTMDSDTAWFLDGQVTLNDESHVGFNVGAGFRTLADSDLIGERVVGLSLWADGSSTINDNFFPQVGMSYELLGEDWDLRANASFVVGDQTQTGDTVIVGGLSYDSFNLVQTSLTGIDNAMHLTELEVARRIADRELWGFAGAYGLYGDGVDTAGYKLGLRGYATPDLAVSVAVTDDDLFATNTVFSLTWFVGRTRTNTPLTCDLRDRFRDPVIRNDYVAVYQQSEGGGGALTNDFDGDGNAEDIRFVHIDSNAAAGGDGSFENPFNSLNAAEAAGTSLANDNILVHGGTTYAGQTGLTLLDGQRLLGEGDDMTFTIATDQFGTLLIPETSTGAQALAAPVVNLAAGATGVTLADSNEVANLDFNGGATAIAAAGTGAGDPNLHDLDIDGTTGNAIELTPFERVDGANTTIAFNARLDTITFNNVGGNDIDIDATSVSDPTNANVTLNETISITNITSTNNAATSLAVTGTHAGGTLTVDNYDWDGGTTGAIGMQFTGNAGTTNVTNSALTGGAAGAIGFDITGNSGTVAIGTSNTVTDINGQAANIATNSATVDFAATVSNTTVSGGTVVVDSNTAAVTVNGDITTQDVTSLQITDALADVTVSGDITRNGTAGVAVDITDNAVGDGATILFSDPNSTITSNNGSQAVSVTDGDDDVTFLGSITDTGGIRVTGRSGGTVDFGGGVTSTTGINDAVLLTNNDGARIDFMDLDITTSTGRGFLADSGDINVTGASSIETTAATIGGLVLDGTAGTITSTNGVTFASIDTAVGSTNAINLDNVQGNVTVNGGVLNTTDTAVQINNATGVTLAGVEMNSTSGDAVIATYDHDQDNNLSVSGADMNGGNVTVATTTVTVGADTTVSISNSTEAGAFDFDTTGAGNLAASMSTVTGTGATTLDVSGDGNGSLTMNTVDTGQAVTATSTGGSTGNLTLNMANSGNTTQFTDVQVNGQGTGSVTADLTNTEISGTFDFDAVGNGPANMEITGGMVGGAVTADANNTGDFTATLNGAGNYQSTVTINANNTGQATINATGGNTIDGAFAVNAANGDDATISLTSNFNNLVSIVASNDENLTYSMIGSTVTTGAGGVGYTLDINNQVEMASVVQIGNTFDTGTRIDAGNSQAFSLDINNDNVSTGSDDIAFNLNLESGPSTADIRIANSSYDTNGAVAFDLTNDNANTVRFQLDNNDFENESNTLAAANLDINAGTFEATIGIDGATSAGNSFTNNANATSQFLMTAAAGSTVNVRYQGNTHNGNAGNYEFDNTAAVTFEVFDLDNSDGFFTNQGTFVPTGAFTESPTAPNTPNP